MDVAIIKSKNLEHYRLLEHVGSIFQMLFLLGGVAVLVFGLFSTGMLKDPGTVASLRQIRVLALVMLILTIVTLIFAQRRRMVTLLGCVLTVTVLFGLGATVSTVYLLVASLAIGELIVRDRSWLKSDEVNEIPVLVIVGLAVLIIIAGFLTHFPVNTAATYLLGLTIPIFIARAAIARRLQALIVWATSSELSGGKTAPWLIALILYLLLIHMFGAALPERYADALAMHLVVPTVVSEHAKWSFDVTQFVWAVMPMGGAWLYTISYLLGGEIAAKLVNLSCFLLVVWLLAVELRRWLSPSAALLATALFVSTPIAFIETASLFVENPLMMFLFAAYIAGSRAIVDITAVRVGVAFLLLAAAVSVKVHAVFVAVPLGTVLLISAVLQRGVRGALPSFLVASILTLIGLKPYLYALFATGNPVFPFLNAVFKSPYFPSAENFADRRWERGWDPTLIYKMTFASDRFLEGWRGAFGFQVLVFGLAGVVAVFSRPRAILLLALMLAGTYVLAMSAQIQYIRYFYPVFPLLTIVCGLALTLPGVRWRPWEWSAGIVALLVIALNFWFMPSAGWILRVFDVRAALSPTGKAELVRRQAPQRGLVEVVNSLAGKDARVAIFGTPAGAGLRGTAVYANWYNLTFLEELRRAQSTEAVRAALSERLIDYAIVRDGSLQRFPYVQEFLESSASLVVRFNHAALYRIDADVRYHTELLKDDRYQMQLDGRRGGVPRTVRWES